MTEKSAVGAILLFLILAHGSTGTPALAESHSPLADTFWSELFGMPTDKFGNHWLLSYHSSATAASCGTALNNANNN